MTRCMYAPCDGDRAPGIVLLLMPFLSPTLQWGSPLMSSPPDLCRLTTEAGGGGGGREEGGGGRIGRERREGEERREGGSVF